MTPPRKHHGPTTDLPRKLFGPTTDLRSKHDGPTMDPPRTHHTNAMEASMKTPRTHHGSTMEAYVVISIVKSAARHGLLRMIRYPTPHAEVSRNATGCRIR